MHPGTDLASEEARRTADQPHAVQTRQRPERRGRTDARLLVAIGAVLLSVSAILIDVSGTTPATAAFFRCLLALPVLVPLALREVLTAGRRSWRRCALDLLAGVMLGVDFTLWAESIASVGAGISTVVVNVQVIVVPLLALALTRERLPRAFLLAAPVLLVGVALAGGVADSHAFGTAPVRGALLGAVAGVGYGGYLFLLRLGGDGTHRVTPVCLATTSAAATSLAVGLPWHGVEFAISWQSFAWLVALALSGQVLAWLLIGPALPRLRSSSGATLLLLQPILAVLLGVLLLGEHPGTWQLAGCALVVLAVWFTSRRG